VLESDEVDAEVNPTKVIETRSGSEVVGGCSGEEMARRKEKLDPAKRGSAVNRERWIVEEEAVAADDECVDRDELVPSDSEGL